MFTNAMNYAIFQLQFTVLYRLVFINIIKVHCTVFGVGSQERSLSVAGSGPDLHLTPPPPVSTGEGGSNQT